MRGYLSPSGLGRIDPLDLLTPEGEHQELPLASIRSVYFVREFSDDFEPERKAFLSRPKLDGLWLRLRYLDGDTLEGVVPNDLLSLIDNGLQITPPDLNSSTDRIFIPRTALSEVREAIGGYRARGLAAEIEAARRTLDLAGVTLILDSGTLDSNTPGAPSPAAATPAPKHWAEIVSAITFP